MNNSSIAFYSPLKPITHAVPSGDRLMARLLVACLQNCGYKVDIASQLRAFLRDPHSQSDRDTLIEHADAEIRRLSGLWQTQGAPQLWFCYHPYFKSPDLIGPPLCQRFDIPYVTAEASYSIRRRQGVWASMQERVLASINHAAVNICFTERDRTGLRKASATAELAILKPFIDLSVIAGEAKSESRDCSGPFKLVTVAMMRAGDKFDSYKRLAAALSQMPESSWSLSVIGEGALLEPVKELFNAIPSQRVVWHGLLEAEAIATVLRSSDLYVWPGCGEAYGLAYLEAQAAGLPVVAYHTAGVPEVVSNGYTGLLTPVGDDAAYAQAISSLQNNSHLLQTMSENAVLQVQRYHSDQSASVELQRILQSCTGL